MRLTITTPLVVVVDDADVVSVRAEDASGGFGIMGGHADLLTALAVSVLSWRRTNGKVRHCAVKGGVLTATGGDSVAVATREAVVDDNPDTLEQTILARFRADRETERAEHTEATRLQLAAIRQIMRHLRPDGHAPGSAG